MGVLNVTPNSFSDGGLYIKPEEALRRAQEMVLEGVDIIDVGGESSRPGAKPVSVEEELDRVIPVVEKLSSLPISISIDTTKPEVMAEAVSAGADMVNDISSLQSKSSIQVVKNTGVSVCLMHMQGCPDTMQDSPQYNSVVDDVYEFFKSKITECEVCGVNKNKIILDPGFGFGKTLQHNLLLMKHIQKFKDFSVPLMIGVSRKSMIGEILKQDNVNQRLVGSLSLAVIAVWQGVDIIRVHDVKETIEAIKICSAVMDVD
ncbi:MAG: dihydropteroate synthase [Methylococcales bacterium]|nr:dihydropteroate synthase [Methylococcales bacterium]MBT7410833.1 dihydropteroate synthase [Methylococcales bacterium]